jgi:hypothetical protein
MYKSRVAIIDTLIYDIVDITNFNLYDRMQ